MEGILPIDKPKGPTSHDVVARLRRLLGIRRIGHAGTLDPMAEGVLVCCLGRATRVMPWLVGLGKEYTGEITLGARSDTYDAEGRIEVVDDAPGVTAEQLEEAMRAGVGMVEQAAPPYSAVKVDGRKLYDYARQGEEAPRKVRTVWIEKFHLVRYLPPRVLFVAVVGTGTYIRSMAHELGERLGCGAHLSALRRTRVGGFESDNAVGLDFLESDPEAALAEGLLTVSEGLAHLPRFTVSRLAEERVRFGGVFEAGDILECAGPQPVGEPTLVFSLSGELLSIAQTDSAEAPYRPLRVLCAS